jgi:hypothetical protein
MVGTGVRAPFVPCRDGTTRVTTAPAASAVVAAVKMKVSAVALPVMGALNVKEVAVITFPTAVEASIVAAAMLSGPVAALTVTAAVREGKFAIWFLPAGVERPASVTRVQVAVPVGLALTVMVNVAVAWPELVRAAVPAVPALPQVSCSSLTAISVVLPLTLGSTRTILSSTASE